MKKFFMMLFAALSISVAASACDYVTAFSDKYESAGFYVQSGKVYIKDCSHTSNFVATYSKNPYKNAEYCAPNKSWSTCYDFCFTYDGKTYFFSL